MKTRKASVMEEENKEENGMELVYDQLLGLCMCQNIGLHNLHSHSSSIIGIL